jgi:hypothetical protein
MMKGLTVWTAQGEKAVVESEGEYLVTLSNKRTYKIWDRTEVEGCDRFYLSEQDRDSDTVTKLTNRVLELEAVLKDRYMHRALTIFIDNEDHVQNFFSSVEKVLTNSPLK